MITNFLPPHERGPRVPEPPDVRKAWPGRPALFLLGFGVGAVGTSYIYWLKIIPQDWNPAPLIFCWAFLTVCWVVGRFTDPARLPRGSSDEAWPPR